MVGSRNCRCHSFAACTVDVTVFHLPDRQCSHLGPLALFCIADTLLIVFLALCTGVLNTIACVCRRRVEAGGFQLVYGWRVFIAGGIRVGEGDVLAFFSGSACVCIPVETVVS